MTAERVWQPGFDSLGTPLHTVEFVVVDLETNGLPSHEGGITEIGAVKVRGGEVVAEFQTLVNPGCEIPPFITLLTGITTDMVADAPDLTAALPAFLDWAGPAVLVAHNAGFDIGFLKAGCQRIGREWHGPAVLDTLTLAKAALLPDEVPNRKLGTLAAHFGSPSEPVHRALADARATVHVLHALFERLGSVGVETLEDALEVGVQINASRRKKRTIAEHLPQGPGVYIFRDDQGRPLYVGKSNNIRRRALSYFTRAEERDRMGKMVDLAASISAIECATELEASVRELRLLQEAKPAFNRAGIHSERTVWLRLTNDVYPRLSAVRAVRPDLGIRHFGPVRNLEQASLVIDAVTSLIGLRTCTQRLRKDRPSPSCALADMGRCSAPCDHRVSAEQYSSLVEEFLTALDGASSVEDELRRRIADLAAGERYEEAAVHRDRLAAWLSAVSRSHRLGALTTLPELVCAAPGASGWEVHAIRHGRLAASWAAPSEADLEDFAATMLPTATAVAAPPPPAPAGSVAEARLILGWLRKSDARIVHLEGDWASPWPSQQSALTELREIESSKQAVASVSLARRQSRFTAPR